MVVVFHRADTLDLGGLVAHRTASFPTGVVRVADDDNILDHFSHFVAGFSIQDMDTNRATQVEWRKTCRALGRREDSHPGHLLFRSPSSMVAFTQHATMLSDLLAGAPSFDEGNGVKNREARIHRPPTVLRPTVVGDVQRYVRWAVKNQVGLTIIGGGHSGHCLSAHIIAVDMSAFDRVHILSTGSDPLVVVEAGCKSGNTVRQTIAAGLTVPLGACPSTGAGLWLQGGIGHLARLHGLTCDAIVGAVMIGVTSGQALYIGRVPMQYRPVDAVRPENEEELLWAIKGAGTNFGVVISVIFKAYTAPTYIIHNWVFPPRNKAEAQSRLGSFDELVAKGLPRNYTADAYMYGDTDQLLLGVSVFETSTSGLGCEAPLTMSIRSILGPEDSSTIADGIGLFETEMYMSGMHGGHVGGKTSSFKRCVFLRRVECPKVTSILVAAVENRPGPLCYFHLLQGGGAVGDVAGDATAFGCRDWAFACVVTGVWPRDQDGAEINWACVHWIYNVFKDLLPFCSGAYGADLGPDPRDRPLAAKAFGSNRSRLACLKRDMDPGNALAYACPLSDASAVPKVVVLVTGDSGVGKDHCADLWATLFSTEHHLVARTASISDVTKREYAGSTGADLDRLLSGRTYKEQHRPALTSFFEGQVQQCPWLPQDHFLSLVHNAKGVDILFITGMRDEAPVSAFSHLVPDIRLLELRIEANGDVRRGRREYYCGDGCTDLENTEAADSNVSSMDHCPNLVFNNDTPGKASANEFAIRYLLPFFHADLQRLANMVRRVVNFPRPGVEFCHVLDIAQKPGGLVLCTSLLRAHFNGDWTKVDMLVSCEAGGFVFASALAARVGVGLALVRDGAKLPPPTASVLTSSSHISSLLSNDSKQRSIEINLDVIPKDGTVVVLDNVLATGETLCAVLRLLSKAGVKSKKVSVMVVAEFPIHRGRALLRQHGFGGVDIQSLLVFGGA